MPATVLMAAQQSVFRYGPAVVDAGVFFFGRAHRTQCHKSAAPPCSRRGNGDYRCLDQREYAELVCEFIERLPETMIIQRLTGDPHPKELVAPAWSLHKKETLEMIHAIFDQKNTWQGKRFDPEKQYTGSR